MVVGSLSFHFVLSSGGISRSTPPLQNFIRTLFVPTVLQNPLCSGWALFMSLPVHFVSSSGFRPGPSSLLSYVDDHCLGRISSVRILFFFVQGHSSNADQPCQFYLPKVPLCFLSPSNLGNSFLSSCPIVRPWFVAAWCHCFDSGRGVCFLWSCIITAFHWPLPRYEMSPVLGISLMLIGLLFPGQRWDFLR